jgi:DNA repair protein RecO (recombination protein O)
MVETADKLVDHEKEPALQQYRLLRGGLNSLANREHTQGLVLDAYLLRALAVAGWAASFDSCATCGKPGPHRAFNAAGGGAVCDDDRPQGAASPAPETFRLLAALMSGDWGTADASEERHRREAAGLVAAFAQFHLERMVRSLGMVDRSTQVARSPLEP